jgi:RNA polymerase sigma-70 factor (ECF subfamily)
MPMVTENVDATLLDRCATGDILAFREIYERWKNPLYTLAYRFHGNREDAEDSLQDAFVHMYRGIAHFRREAKFESWMYRIVMNACISSKRPRRTTEQKTDFTDERRQPGGTENEGDAVMRDILEEEIARLSELQRAVFLLYAGQGLTHPDIAEVLRIGVGTSKSYYHRARLALQAGLARRGISNPEVEE